MHNCIKTYNKKIFSTGMVPLIFLGSDSMLLTQGILLINFLIQISIKNSFIHFMVHLSENNLLHRKAYKSYSFYHRTVK